MIAHGSSAVTFESYQDLLDRASTLLPSHCRVVFLADRGFADTKLMAHLRQTRHWHWRIRIKSRFYVYRKHQRRIKISTIKLKRGQARFGHNGYITANQFGPVHLALAKPHGSKEDWLIVSDEPTDVTTFDEYGLRFDIEEGFLDDKSGGFQLESSQIRSAQALERLCFVLAVATFSWSVKALRSSKIRSAAGWTIIGFVATATSISAGNGCNVLSSKAIPSFQGCRYLPPLTLNPPWLLVYRLKNEPPPRFPFNSKSFQHAPLILHEICQSISLPTTNQVGFQGENYATIVAARARPQSQQSATELVCSQCRRKNIGLHLLEYIINAFLQRGSRFANFR